MARNAEDLAKDPAVVVTNTDEDCSPDTLAAFIDELLAGPEPDLGSLGAVVTLHAVRRRRPRVIPVVIDASADTEMVGRWRSGRALARLLPQDTVGWVRSASTPEYLPVLRRQLVIEPRHRGD